MSDIEETNKIDSGKAKHFKIRREVVGAWLLAAIFWAAYQVNDWWTHVNWPPFPGTNRSAIEALGCKDNFPIDAEKLKEWASDIDPRRSIDKRNLSLQPQCLAATYLAYEGSGTRQYIYIVDTEKRRRSAKVVITFEADERALK